MILSGHRVLQYCMAAGIGWCFVEYAHAGTAWTPLAYDTSKASADNPLKGFAAYSYSGEYTFPHSLEFDYVGLDDLMDGPSSFTFDAGLEPLLNGIASHGNQAIVRVFLDYPDFRSAIPQFLIDGGLDTTAYNDHGGGISPDYDDPNLVAALEAFIAAFGQQYDGDPRIAFIQVGLLGFWGEWHTYPRDELFASVSTQNRVLTAFDAAFDKSKLLLSQDSMGQDPVATLSGRGIGFHDDDFANNTLPPGDDQFWSRILALGFDQLWKTQPIGGEIQPDYQEDIWDLPSGAPEDYNSCVDTTHATWLLNYAAFENTWNEAKLARAVAGAKRLGYELFASEVSLPNTAVKAVVDVGVRIENRGVAPFYYDWILQLAALNGDGDPVETWNTDWRLTTVLPGVAATEFSAPLDTVNLAAGDYTLGLRVINPMVNGKPLRFANATQGATWLELGAFTVTPAVPVETDVDASGDTDAVDVQLVINAALGIEALPSADIDNNGEVDAVDVQLVINGALGLL
jgi:hypothetical protein